MKCWLKHFVTILVFLIQRCETAEESSSEHLTSEMYFETVRQSKRSSFVMFFQAWCGNSKRLQPDWERLAAKYKFEASLMIGGVNCGEEGPLCKHKDIRNYPSLLYYIDGEEYEYNGPRSYDDLVDFVETTLLPQCETQLPATTCSIKAQSYISKVCSKFKTCVNLILINNLTLRFSSG